MAAKPKTAQQRKDDPQNFWHRDMDNIAVGREQWRVYAYRGGRPLLRLDSLVEAVSWVDAEDPPMLTGAMTLRQPFQRRDRRFDLMVGDSVTVDVADRPGASFRRELTMRVAERTSGVREGALELTLEDPLAFLGRSKDDFHYAKGKGHPNGWFPHQIVRDIASRYGFAVGQIVAGKTRTTKLIETNKSPVDIIKQVYKAEEERTGRSYVIAWRHGKLTVLPFQRSRQLMLLGPKLSEASFRQALGEDFATVLRVSGAKDRKTGGRTKAKVTEIRTRNAARYGRVVKRVEAGKGKTDKERRADLAEKIKKASEPDRELTLTHPGIVGLRRGHAIQITLPSEAIKKIVYVKEISHTVAPGGYEIEVTCDFQDPYVDADDKLAKAKLCAAAKRRGRKPPKDCPGSKKPAKPAAAAQQADVDPTAAPDTAYAA